MDQRCPVDGKSAVLASERSGQYMRAGALVTVGTRGLDCRSPRRSVSRAFSFAIRRGAAIGTIARRSAHHRGIGGARSGTREMTC